MTEPADQATGVPAVEIVVACGDADLASGLLWGTGVSAVVEEPAGPDRVRLRCEIPPGGLELVTAALESVDAEVSLVEVDDGLDGWRPYAEVSRAGRRLVVHPPWIPLGSVDDDAVVIELDPGRSWGHGAHPTSRLCLAEVEQLVDRSPGCRVVDVGCGSGVLSVAAAALGANRVDAIDIDPEACRATTANAERNGVADRVHVHHVPPGSEREPLAEIDGPADVLVANIGAAALVELAPHLLARVAADGNIVISGLLDPPPAEVPGAFAPRRLVRTVCSDGWSVLVLA